MKKKALFFIFFVLFLLIFVMAFLSKKESKSKITLEKGNGAVINIWIDDFSRLDVLRNHKVKYLFVDVGNMDDYGKITTPETEIKNFLDFMNKYEKEKNYDFILLPYSEVIASDYNIASESFKGNFVNDYVRFAGMGFDGLLVDIEGMPSEVRGDYLDLLARLRKRLPPNSVISVYAGSLSDSPNEWEWGSSFYRQVSYRVDLISATGYDTDLTNPDEYKGYIKEQVSKITSGNFNTKFLFAVPTHKPYPETVENALSAYTSEIRNHPENNFLGVVVFAEWTADKQEWDVFEKYIKDNKNH